MKTEDRRFAVIRDLFAQAIHLTPANRELLLEKECADDPSAAQEIRTLLAIDSTGAGAKLTDAVSSVIRSAGRLRHQDLVGTILGSYKLVSVLGQGGSGVVYLAERADRQYAARVAIKVVEAASTYEDLGRRFGAERQILATLNHTNIARLIDAGETPQHYPYIVMEYVHGMAIDSYCDTKRLPLEARLRLFLQICSAVQYAHQNLIVHRDLKPSNILVSEDGTPKLLDFGIAKLLASSGPALALTRLNDRALTPEYASPEQIAGRLITTASDVYALGVVLYELLAGFRPYKITSSSQLELERYICVVDPPKPSVAVARAGGTGDNAARQSAIEAAAARGLSTNRLRDLLSGDLDAIVMRALRKEPEQRYASVEQLAADIERHLRMQPVAARHGNWFYYARRFLRRNIIPVTAVTVVATALITSAIVTTILYQRARVDRDRAARAQQVSDRVSGFMDTVFSQADPYAAQGRDVSARELLDSASRRISDLDEEPEVRARLLKQFGHAYQRLGQYGQAVELLGNAAVLERRLQAGTNSSQLALTLTHLAMAQRGLGNFSESESTFAEALRLLESQNTQRSTDYADLLREMGRLEHTRGALQEAERYYVESIEIMRKLRGERSIEVAVGLSELTALYSWKNDLKAAERTGREALSIYQSALPELHPDRIFVQLALGDVLYQEHHVEEAAALIERSVLAQRTLYHNNGPQLAQSLQMLAWVRQAQGHLEDAESVLTEALQIAQRSVGEEHYETGYSHTSLASVQIQLGKYGEAEQHLRKALSIFEKSLPQDHQYFASARHWLGEAMLATGRYEEAEATLTSALSIWQKSKAPAWLAARTESALGQALAERGNMVEATKHLRTAYEKLKAERGTDDAATRVAQERLERVTARKGTGS